VDPLMAFVPMEYDTNSDQHVRLLLSALALLAERGDCAILLVRHLNKTPGASVLYRGGGSIGIAGIARSAMLAPPGRADRDGLRRVLAMTKQNLAAPSPSLAYRIEETATGAAAICWDGEVAVAAAELLAPRRTASPERQEALRVLEEAGEELDAPAMA